MNPIFRGVSTSPPDPAGDERVLLARLSANADDAEAAAMLGGLLNRTGRAAEAARFLRPCVERASGHPELRRELAFAYILCARLDAALETLAPVFANHSDQPDVRRLFERAIVALGRGQERSYTERRVWQQVGGVLLGLGERRGAELCDRAALGEAPAGEQYAEFALGSDIAAHCAAAGGAVHVVRGQKIEPPPGAFASLAPPLDSFVCALPDGRVLGQSFIPAAADGTAFTVRCIPNINKHLNANAVEALDTVRIGAASRILCRSSGTDEYRGRHVLLGSHENVGHWSFHHFGRLRLVDEVPALADAPLVVGDRIKPTQIDSLLRAGIAQERIVRIPLGRIARFEELWVPSLLMGGTPTRSWNPGLTGYIRRRLKLEFPSAPGRRLFIGRTGARWRRLLNEPEVLGALAEFGFESIDPGAMSLEEQIRAASSAQIIVAVFGAGSNLHLFAPESAPLVELKFDVRNQMDIHPMLTEDIGQPHYAVTGEVRNETEDILHSDFVVPPEAVRAAVREALAALGA